MPPAVYCVYGLQVLADAPIPGMSALEGADRIDIRMWLNRMPPWWQNQALPADAIWYRSPNVDEQGQPRLTVWKMNGDCYRLSYSDGTDFLVDPEGGEVWSVLPANAARAAAAYLIGPVMGFLLRVRGICCLHASAVQVGGRVIAFTGPRCAGKSTTAAAFEKAGYRVVSDDITALVERGESFLAQPGYPRLWLWPDAAESLYGSSLDLPRILPGGEWDKCYVDLTSGGREFQTQSLPLSAIYVLEERMKDAARPTVKPIAPSAALVKLAANTYMNYLLDPALRAREFEILGRLVMRVPVRRVIPQADAACLPELCRAIVEDLGGLT
jgi:hypothetical protein